MGENKGVAIIIFSLTVLKNTMRLPVQSMDRLILKSVRYKWKPHVKQIINKHNKNMGNPVNH